MPQQQIDTLERYRQIVRDLIETYAQFKPSHGQIESEVVFDPRHDHYELMYIGWDGVRRIHGSFIHIDIIDGKVWVQHDGTSVGVANELADAGIPHDEIVLGFKPAHVRPLTGFAVA